MTASTPTRNDLANRHEILRALEFGRPQDIEKLRGKINWDTLVEKGKPLSTVLGVTINEPTAVECVENACLVLIDCALHDGRQDILGHADWTAQGRRNRIHPLVDMTLSSMNRVLAKFLAAGLDPCAPFHDSPESNLNLLQLAEAVGKDMTVNLFRAYTARSFFNDLLAEIEIEATNKTRPS